MLSKVENRDRSKGLQNGNIYMLKVMNSLLIQKWQRKKKILRRGKISVKTDDSTIDYTWNDDRVEGAGDERILSN